MKMKGTEVTQGTKGTGTMRSALRASLTDERLLWLTQYAVRRFEDLRQERERSAWWAKREKYERVAASDFNDRTSRGDANRTTIFDRVNQSLKLVHSVRRFLMARCAKDLFGSKPWFKAEPQGRLDKILAGQIDKHAAWKLDQANYTVFAKEAMGAAFDLGEAVMKTTWKVDTDVYERIAMILWDRVTGAPVVTANGEYIYDTDALSAESGTQVAENAEGGAVDTSEGENHSGAPTDSGAAPEGQEGAGVVDPQEKAEAGTPAESSENVGRSFEKAPEITWKEGYEFREHLIEEKTRLYSGLDCSTIHWKDFYWPINSASLEASDCRVHVYDMAVSDLEAQYDPDGVNEELQETFDFLRQSSPEPKSEESLPKKELGEPQAIRSDAERPVVKIAEFYLDCDVLDDGVKRRIYFVLALDHQRPIWVDYRATISPRSACPVHVLAINKVKNRVYGRGLFEIYEDAMNAQDKLLCSILFRNAMNADPVKIWNPHMTLEGETDPHLRIEPGKTYTARGPGTKPVDILAIIEMPDLDDRTWSLMQLFMQLVQVDSGVTNQAQAALSDMPANETATASNALTEISSVIHLFIVEELRDGYKPQVEYAIELLYFRQDEDETYEYLEGQASQVLALADAQTLRNLPMNVEISLTRVRQQQMREAAVAAVPFAQAYYDRLGLIPGMQVTAAIWAGEKLLPMHVQAFRGLGIDNADDYFPTIEELQQAVAQAMQAAAVAAQQAQQDAAAQQGAGEQGAGTDTGGGEQQQAEQMPSNVIAAPATAAA